MRRALTDALVRNVPHHTPRDVGKKHYDLYEREREKRRALDMWASVLKSILEGRKHDATVVPLKKARGHAVNLRSLAE
jgi:hypothetical protein